MVQTIGVAGCDVGARRLHAQHLLFGAGCAASAAGFMAVVGGIGGLLPLKSVALFALLPMSVWFARESLPGATHPWLSVQRQVSRRSFDRWHPRRVALIWGAEQGLGVVTVVNSWALWLSIAGVLAYGSVIIGAVVGTAYGTLRGLQLPLSVMTKGAGSLELSRLAGAVRRRLRVTLPLGVMIAVVSIGQLTA